MKFCIKANSGTFGGKVIMQKSRSGNSSKALGKKSKDLIYFKKKIKDKLFKKRILVHLNYLESYSSSMQNS
jgi:hypothetical protein